MKSVNMFINAFSYVLWSSCWPVPLSTAHLSFVSAVAMAVKKPIFFSFK